MRLQINGLQRRLYAAESTSDDEREHYSYRQRDPSIHIDNESQNFDMPANPYSPVQVAVKLSSPANLSMADEPKNEDLPSIETDLPQSIDDHAEDVHAEESNKGFFFVIGPGKNGNNFQLRPAGKKSDSLQLLMDSTVEWLSDFVKDDDVKERRLSIKSTGPNTCLYNYINNQGWSHWTVEHAGVYACKFCTNRQRPCMVKFGGITYILPLPPAARYRSVMPKGSEPRDEGVTVDEPAYWLAPQKTITRHVQALKDLWIS